MSPAYRYLALAFSTLVIANGQPAEPHSLSGLLGARGFVRVPPGQFTMGSSVGNPDELPMRPVRIARGFEMSRYEITQAQWNAVMSDPHAASYNTTGASADVNPSHFKGDAKPVENISWEQVQVFIAALNKRDPRHTYRLPTEAEWEYAARAGSKDETPEPDTVAWYKDNSGGETHDVGQKKPNAWGLHDMLGNVFEWVQDWYTPESYASGTSAQPANPRSYKVYRGCGWLSERKYCRPAYRMFDFPTQGQYTTGFRLVRTRK